MKLTIVIPCNTGEEMENSLNKCISDFTEALLKRGFSEMNLTAYGEEINPESLLYKLELKQ